jgi:hypothetical protein
LAIDFQLVTAQCNSRCYLVFDMEEEAIITAVHPEPGRTIDKSLHLEFLYVSFRVLADSKYRNKSNKVTLMSPNWLSELQTSAPIDGYLMENGELTVSLPKDERIKENLKVILEVSDRDLLS